MKHRFATLSREDLVRCILDLEEQLRRERQRTDAAERALTRERDARGVAWQVAIRP